MSDNSEEKSEVKTESEVNEAIDSGLEAAADEAFGSEIEISAQAAAGVEGETRSAEEIAAEAETKEADAAKAKEREGKSPEEIEKLEADAAEKAKAKANEGKTPEEIAEADAAEKAKAEAAEKEDQYSVPDELKGRTRERFEKLTTKLKDAHELSEKQEDIIKSFQGVLEKSGLNSTEVQNTLALGSLLKTDPKRALETLTTLVKDLSAQQGVVPPGADALAGFDDLKQQVVDRELSVENATAIAEGRIRKAAEEKNTQTQDAATKAQQQQKVQDDKVTTDFNTSVTTAQVGVGAFLKTIERDPDFDKIAPRLVEAAKFAAESLAPEKWLGYIEGEHKKIKDIASSLAPSRGASPIVDGSSPPGGEKAPQNLEQLADSML